MIEMYFFVFVLYHLYGLPGDIYPRLRRIGVVALAQLVPLEGVPVVPLADEEGLDLGLDQELLLAGGVHLHRLHLSRGLVLVSVREVREVRFVCLSVGFDFIGGNG